MTSAKAMGRMKMGRMRTRGALVVVFVALIAGLMRSEETEEESETLSAGTCLTSQNKYLSLTCVEGHVVRLIRSFLGHSTQSTCEYSPGDCTMDLPASVEDDDCAGTNTCQVSIQENHRRKIIPGCGKTGNYVQALYQCMSESSVRSVCDPAAQNGVVHRLQRGFLRTPGYPSPYPDDLDCNLTLMAPYENQRLMLFVVDLDLEPSGTGCSDWMQVFDGFQSITLCNRRKRYWLRNSTQRLFHIRMYSDSYTSHSRGFWLYYEAFPFLPSTDPVVDTSSPLRSTASLPPPPPPPSPHPPPHPPQPTQSSMTSPSLAAAAADHVVYVTSEGVSLPLTVLMGVAVALITCVFVTLLVFVFIKSRSSANRSRPDDPDRPDNLERERRALQWTHSPHPRALTPPSPPPQRHALILPPSSAQLYHSNSVKTFTDNKQDNC